MLNLEQFKMLEYFNKGGPVMWPLLLISIIGVAFIFERFWHYHVVSINTTEFLERIRKVLKQRKVKEAIQVCENYRGPIASILKAGLMKAGAEREEVEHTMSTAASLELSRLERGLVVLSTCATVGPLLGFLGTVAGMIKSFDIIAKAGLNNPGLVALGISEALITTATGLIVAIPMSIGYNYFTSRVAKMTMEMEEASEFLLDLMVEGDQPQPAAAKPAAPAPAKPKTAVDEKTRPF